MNRSCTIITLALLAAMAAPGRTQDAAALTTGLKSDDAATRQKAIDSVSDPSVVGTLIGMLYGNDGRAHAGAKLALRKMVTRPMDTSERSAVANALLTEARGSRPVAQRNAALEFLSYVGDAAHVPPVASLLKDPEMREMARFVLTRIQAPAAGDALVAALPGAEPAFKAALVNALAERGDTRAVTAIRPLAIAPQPEVRIAAMGALGRVGGADSADTLWNLVTKPRDAGERRVARNAYLALAERLRQAGTATPGTTELGAAGGLYLRLYNDSADSLDKTAGLAGIVASNRAAATPLLITAMRSTDPQVRGTAAEGLARLGEGTPVADQVATEIAKGLTGASAADRLALVEILARKDTPAARTGVLAAAKDTDPGVRVAAYRGLNRVAGTLPRQQLLSLYHASLPSAASDAERQEILLGLELLAEPESLPMLRAALARGDNRPQILSAMLPIGAKLVAAGKRDEAIALYRETMNNPGSARVARESAAALRLLGVPVDSIARFGFIANWWLLGPIPGRDEWKEKDAIPTETAPDVAGKANVAGAERTWKHVVVDDPTGMLDLHAALANQSDVAAYGYAEVTSSSERNALLKIGSDDDAALWLNGERVYKAIADRAWNQDQDVVPVKLKAGVNRILVKVLNGGGDWAVSVRITDPSGTPLNLKQRTAETKPAP